MSNYVELIGRKGYSGMGAEDIWLEPSGPIASFGAAAQAAAKAAGPAPSIPKAPSSSWWQDAFKGVLSTFGGGQQQQAPAAPQQQQQAAKMASWVLPAAIGGGALVLVLVLKK